MLDMGYSKTWQQCRTKIKNLTQRYRKVKDANRVSGSNRTTCPFYNEIDAILGTRAASAPPSLLESGTKESADDHARSDDFGKESTIPAMRCSETPSVLDTADGGEYTTDGVESLPSDIGTDVNVDGGSSGDISSGSTTNTSGSIASPSSTSTSSTSTISTPTCSALNRRGMKRKKESDFSSETLQLLAKIDEQAEKRAEERERKRVLLEATLDEERREQERKHEERMQMMMLNFMQQIMCVIGSSNHPPSTSLPLPPPIPPYVPDSQILVRPPLSPPQYTHGNPYSTTFYPHLKRNFEP